VYAGWVVNEELGIMPKTLRGNWEALVTTEEFERGIEILTNRSKKKVKAQKHDYLLRSLVFLEASPDDPTQPGNTLYRLACSTSNTGRARGGTAHYRLARYPINFPCSKVEALFEKCLQEIYIDKNHIEDIREYYLEHTAELLGKMKPNQRQTLEQALKRIDEEEARVLRLYASGMVSEEHWLNFWAEWNDKRRKLKQTIELNEEKYEQHIGNLDQALTIISNLSIIYKTLAFNDRKQVIRGIVERIVLRYDGMIARIDLQPPFSYLRDIHRQVREDKTDNRKTDEVNSIGSTTISGGGAKETRTHDPFNAIEVLSQLSYNPM
jgi:thiol-disulfide isomerase/thioredoxin